MNMIEKMLMCITHSFILFCCVKCPVVSAKSFFL